MKNPFQYLQDRRETEEAEKEREEKAKREAIDKVNLARAGAASRCDEMVTEVLEFLRKAAYPQWGFTVTKDECPTCPTNSEYEPAWGIGKVVPDGDRSTRWATSVRVSLTFDERNQPTQFDVCVGSQSRECGLTESDLVATLKRLHH